MAPDYHISEDLSLFLLISLVRTFKCGYSCCDSMASGSLLQEGFSNRSCVGIVQRIWDL